MAVEEGQSQNLSTHPWEKAASVKDDVAEKLQKKLEKNQKKADKKALNRQKKVDKKAKNEARRNAFHFWRKQHRVKFVLIIAGVILALVAMIFGIIYLIKINKPKETATIDNISLHITTPMATSKIAYERVRKAATSYSFYNSETSSIDSDMLLDNINKYTSTVTDSYELSFYKMATIVLLRVFGQNDLVKEKFEQINSDGYDDNQLYSYYLAGAQYGMVLDDNDATYNKYTALLDQYKFDTFVYGDDGETITYVGYEDGSKVYKILSSDKRIEATADEVNAITVSEDDLYDKGENE